MFRLSARVRAGLCAAAGGVALCGCGRSERWVKVSGRVLTCEGKPAVGGTIEFRPVDAPDKTGRPQGQPGTASVGTIGPDGTFTLASLPRQGTVYDGALTGPHTVVFEMPPAERPVLSPSDKAALTEAGAGLLKAEEEKIAKMSIYPRPPCSAKLSPGEVEVPAAGGTFEFTLQPK